MEKHCQKFIVGLCGMLSWHPRSALRALLNTNRSMQVSIRTHYCLIRKAPEAQWVTGGTTETTVRKKTNPGRGCRRRPSTESTTIHCPS